MSTRVLIGDCRERLRELPDASVQCCVTSPPYFGLRDYGVARQIGLEDTPDAFVAEMVAVFREVRRVLRDDGVLWLNLGDSYAGGKTGRADTGDADLARRAAAYGEEITDPVAIRNVMIHEIAHTRQAGGWAADHPGAMKPIGHLDNCIRDMNALGLTVRQMGELCNLYAGAPLRTQAERDRWAAMQ